MTHFRLRDALDNLQKKRAPANLEETYLQAKQRFTKRLELIRGTEQGRELRRYRNNLMKRTYNKAGDIGVITARRASGDPYTHFPDEFELLHKRLDEMGVASCFG